MPDFVTALAIESWILWTAGIFLIVCRIISRRMVLGPFKKFNYDDWIMLFIAVTFTGNIVSISQVAQNGSNYLPDGAAELLTLEQRASAIYGSVMTFVTEEFTLFTTWLIKACVLMMYGRLTLGLRQHFAVKVLAIYCAIGFIVVQALFLGHWCLPIEQYWAVPVSNSQCATYYNHMITATVFNISSDLMILAIPLPLLITSQLPTKRKLILCCVFSLGIFVILACVLNRYYNFSEPYSPVFLNWYVGESATMVYVANIPLCWPLLRYIFNLNAFGGSAPPGNSFSKLSPPRKASPKDTYVRQRGRVGYSGDGLPSTSRDLDIGFDQDEFSGGRETRWTPEMDKDSLGLIPAGLRTQWHSQVKAGEKGSCELQRETKAILKTMEVSQYTS